MAGGRSTSEADLRPVAQSTVRLQALRSRLSTPKPLFTPSKVPAEQQTLAVELGRRPRDPPRPQPEPASPKANTPLTPEQARQNLIDAVAEHEAAANESQEATEEFIRFRQNRPGSTSGFGDPSKFDPVVLEALQDRAARAGQAEVEAANKLKAARRAAQEAADRAKGARRGGGFPPPR